MGHQLLDNDLALRLFFTDPIFIPVEKISSETAISTPEVEGLADEVLEFKFIGGNLQKILVLVNDPSNDVSTPEGADLLRNILKFMQLKSADFALVNYADYPLATCKDLFTFFSPKLILGFGIDPKKIALENIGLNKLVTVESCKVLLTTDLPIMAADSALKRTFLSSLKAAL